MKKSYLTLIALLMLFATQAQTITEADLVGEWKPLYIQVNGCTYNFKTDDLTLSDDIIAEEKKKGNDVGGIKNEFKNLLKARGFNDLTFIFKPEKVLEWLKDDKVNVLKYSIISKKKALYLKLEGAGELKVDLKDGFFKLLDEGTGFEVTFEKIQ